MAAAVVNVSSDNNLLSDSSDSVLWGLELGVLRQVLRLWFKVLEPHLGRMVLNSFRESVRVC